jgi:hypothetical protein
MEAQEIVTDDIVEVLAKNISRVRQQDEAAVQADREGVEQ